MRSSVVFVSLALTSLAWSQSPAETPAAAPGAQPAKPEATPVKPEDRCIVEGAVYSVKTGEPLKKAQVQMMKVGANSPLQFGAVTDAAGHFIIENLEPGPYTLLAMRTGYVRTFYGAKGRSQVGTTLTLAKGQRLKDIALKLQVQGVVTGRVLDDDGEPQAGVGIQFSRWIYMDGKKTLMPQGSGYTNDLGEYRAYGLVAGRYYAVANFRENGGFNLPEIRNDKGEQTSYAPTYYPGVLSASEASMVEVTPGAEIAGIDFRLIKTRSLKVSGKIALPVNGRPAGVMLAPRDSGGSPPWDQMVQSMTDPQGNFTLRGVRPGTYTLSSSLWSEESPKSASMTLTVADSDVEGIQLAFGVNPEITGSIQTEDGKPWTKAPLNLFIRPENANMYSMGGSGGEVKEDGTFKLKNVTPERYRPQLWQLPDGHYIKSIRVGSQEVTDDVLDFSKGAGGQVTIVVSAKAARVEGAVKDDKGKAVSSGVIALVPDDRDRRDWYAIGAPDQYGKYIVKNVHPGKYKAFAFDSSDSNSWQDPDWLKPFDDKGEKVEVAESATATQDLTLIVTGEAEK